MTDLNYFLSHGAALEALRCAQENVRSLCRFYPEHHDKELDAAIHDIAKASRRIFEAYLCKQQESLDKSARATSDRAVC